MEISAIVLAAGQSRRMGAAKLLLPWGETTVLGQVVKTISSTDFLTDSRTKTDLLDIIIVTGGWRAEVEAEVARLAEQYPVRGVFNAEYERGEMLSSIQVGLRAIVQPPPPLRGASPQSVGFGGGRVGAALVVLGDQPQVQSRTVREVVRAFEEDEGHIVIPSYHMRRGHPILIPRVYWDEILHMQAPQSLRDFLYVHSQDIIYVDTDESVLQDLDTPEDYQRAQRS